MIVDTKAKVPFQDVVGLIPMAGQGKRISPLPCSKELFPVGFCPIDEGWGSRPKVAAEYLLEKMKLAGITEVFVVLRKGKSDIPEYFGNCPTLETHLAPLMMGMPYGPPYSMDEDYPFVRDRIVALGFADILFQPHDAFVQLLGCQKASQADIVLGLSPAYDLAQMDMVEVDARGQVHSLVLKPRRTHLEHSWICAVWTGIFSQFMHEFLKSRLLNGLNREIDQGIDAGGDLPIGVVIQAATQKGLHVGVIFPRGTYVDIGTPEGLARALRFHLQ